MPVLGFVKVNQTVMNSVAVLVTVVVVVIWTKLPTTVYEKELSKFIPVLIKVHYTP